MFTLELKVTDFTVGWSGGGGGGGGEFRVQRANLIRDAIGTSVGAGGRTKGATELLGGLLGLGNALFHLNWRTGLHLGTGST